MEKRFATEVKTEGRRLAGYVARWDVEARIKDFVEVVRAGAFASAAGRDVLALVDHDPSRLLARTRSGTLRLREDEVGLRFDLDLPDTQTGRDVLALAERGDLGGMSFGFVATDERWSGRRRELRAVDLYEVSVVHAWPAYQGTTVQARAKTPRLNAARRFMEVYP